MASSWAQREPEHPEVSRRTFIASSAVAIAVAAVGAAVTPTTPAMAAWGGHQNGRIPTTALTPIPWKTSDLLQSNAAAALIALNVAFRDSFGYNLPVSSAYRDYAGQVYWRDYWCSRGICGNAAPPGTSNHGWALAIDIGVPINGWSDPIYLWMKANASRWGWIHPSWAEPGGPGPDEAWHWEYSGDLTQPPSTDLSAIYRRNNNMASLYHLRNFDGTSTWALAGDGPGAAAWLEISDINVANGLSLQHGAAVTINWDTWQVWKAAYLSRQPVATA